MIVGKWYKISNGIVNVYNNIPAIGVQKSTIVTKIDGKAKLSTNITKISEIKPGISNLQAKVVKLFEPKSDKVAQAGIIGDATGTIRFVIWKSTAPKKQLKDGQVYDFPFAACNMFNNTLSVSLIADESKESKTEIDVKTTNMTFLGNLVTVQEGSGVVKRCTVEGCGRVLNRMNYCTIHEIQKDFKYDMRVKGVIDTGYEAKFIHVPLKQTEELIGLTLEQAIKQSEHNPLGVESVYMDIKNKIVGKYYIIEGNEMNDRILVSSIKLATVDDMKKSTNLDFKVSPQSTLGDAS
jgi:replication factor A1